MINTLNLVLNEIIENNKNLEDLQKHKYFIKELISYIRIKNKKPIKNINEEALELHCLMMRYSSNLFHTNLLLFSKYIHTENLIRKFLYNNEKVVFLDINTDAYCYDNGSDYKTAQHTMKLKGYIIEIDIPKYISVEATNYFMKPNVGFCTKKVVVPSGKYIVEVTGGYNSSPKGKVLDERKPSKKLSRGLTVSIAVSSHHDEVDETTIFKFINNIDEFNTDFNSFQLEISIDDDWIINELYSYSYEDLTIEENLKPWLDNSKELELLE